MVSPSGCARCPGSGCADSACADSACPGSACPGSGMSSAIHRYVDDVGAKLLIGDHHQLAAIGAGGGMDLLA